MAPDSSSDLPRIPELDDEYELIREVGRGGTAIVYLARDRELGRNVAIKLIRPSHLLDEDAVARLVREARTVGRLQHPNIVMLLGTRRVGAEGGLALLLQFVPGRTLKQRIREEGPLPFADAERILRHVGRALAYAHRRRIVHRDIKPENVYLDDDAGVARLADFGIARSWDSDSGLTLPGSAIGTPTYMSPEQVDGKDLDGRSDIFSLGLVGWEILTGRQPWAGEGLYSVIYKQKNEHLPSLDDLRPDTPANLSRAIQGALHKAPEERWSSAEEFLAALAQGSTLPVEEVGPAPPSSSRPSPGGAPEASRPGMGDARTIQYRRPDGTHDMPEAWDRPDGSPREEPEAWNLTDGSLREERERGEAAALLEGDARGELEGDEHDRGITWEFAEPPPRKRRGWIWAVVAMLVLLAGGAGTAAWVEGPEGPFRSLLAQVLPGSYGPDSAGDGPSEPLPWETLAPGTLRSAPASSSAESRTVAGLGLVQGAGQEAYAGYGLAQPVVFRAEDEAGEPLNGVPVRFEPLPGSGSVFPSRLVTNAEGLAFAAWTLGPEAGPQGLLAMAEGEETVATRITALALAPVPQQMEVMSGSGQTGTTGEQLAGPVEVRITDVEGRGVAGRWIRFLPAAGAGSTAQDSVLTDIRGYARVSWALGPSEGVQRLEAALPGEEGLATTITAEASLPPLSIRPGTAAGGNHTCVLTSGGSLSCWGDNGQGQLGDEAGPRRVGPAAPLPGGPFVQVTTGLSHTCALRPDGRALCWGANDRGQLGDGTTISRPRPHPVEVAPLAEIQAGASHTCGITRQGQPLCWGDNTNGQLGDGTTEPRLAPVAVGGGGASFRTLAVGWRHTCGLTNGGIAYCWGGNASGEAGRAGQEQLTSPTAVEDDHAFEELSAGNAHTCGLTSQGRIFCWGSNENGQLGDGTMQERSAPTPVDTDEAFSALTAGAVHTCAVSESGEAFCWGRNLYGQVGDGSTTDRSRPTPVDGGHRFERLHAFGSHTCGSTPAGDTLCWGYNADGQLGDGTGENRAAPTAVSGEE